MTSSSFSKCLRSKLEVESRVVLNSDKQRPWWPWTMMGNAREIRSKAVVVVVMLNSVNQSLTHQLLKCKAVRYFYSSLFMTSYNSTFFYVPLYFHIFLGCKFAKLVFILFSINKMFSIIRHASDTSSEELLTNVRRKII